MFGERGRWVLVALGASILINLFLAGVVVGRLTIPGSTVPEPQMSGPPPASGALVIGLFPRALIKELPPPEKKAFLAATKAHAAEMKAAHVRVVEARRAVVVAIGAPAYDRALLDAKLADLRQATLDQQIAGHKAAADGLAVLSAASRAAIARDATERLNAQVSANPPPKPAATANETPASEERQPTAVEAPPAQRPAPPVPSAPKSTQDAQPDQKASPEMQAAMKAMRQACLTDIQTLCKDVEPGGGRIAKCLKEHRDDLSAGCKDAWKNVRAVKQGEKN